MTVERSSKSPLKLEVFAPQFLIFRVPGYASPTLCVSVHSISFNAHRFQWKRSHCCCCLQCLPGRIVENCARGADQRNPQRSNTSSSLKSSLSQRLGAWDRFARLFIPLSLGRTLPLRGGRSELGVAHKCYTGPQSPAGSEEADRVGG